MRYSPARHGLVLDETASVLQLLFGSVTAGVLRAAVLASGDTTGVLGRRFSFHHGWLVGDGETARGFSTNDVPLSVHLAYRGGKHLRRWRDGQLGI